MRKESVLSIKKGNFMTVFLVCKQLNSDEDIERGDECKSILTQVEFRKKHQVYATKWLCYECFEKRGKASNE